MKISGLETSCQLHLIKTPLALGAQEVLFPPRPSAGHRSRLSVPTPPLHFVAAPVLFGTAFCFLPRYL